MKKPEMIAKKLKTVQLPQKGLMLETIDMHTGGEPLRIITNGLPEVPGKTMLEKRRYFRDHCDNLRTGIMWEPRGHADMYGAVITEPVSDGADFGTFFLHNDGYSTMCGHAIIALIKFAYETGLINKKPGEAEFLIDAPPGLITARAVLKNDRVERVFFKNVPSFVLYTDRFIKIPEIGEVKVDVAYGGAFYAIANADEIGIGLEAKNFNRLIDLGMKIKKAVMAELEIRHPFEDDLSFLYGTIFTGKPANLENHSRNVCIFANGEVDRSATGSGVSARAALHNLKNDLKPNTEISIESIIGTTMTVKVVEETTFGKFKAVIPEVSGTAFFTGQHKFWFDSEDELKDGFILR